MPTITPLILTPILKPKVWGGRRLARLGKRLPPENSPDALIGESWELADLGSTSVSGGGGEAARSVVTAGPYAGRTLHELMDLWGDDLLPRHLRTASGDFPLLVKFLDAREHLSIQVHPSPAYAAAHPNAHLKTECWFVMDAQGGTALRAGLSTPVTPPHSAPSDLTTTHGREPGASPPSATAASSTNSEPTPGSRRGLGSDPVIYKGIKPGITPADFRKLIAEGRVPEAMLAVPAIVGEMHDLPSGTCHALGAGVLVAEVQTPSDTTFRVYDWAKEYGRQGRALHIEESLACIDFAPAPVATSLHAPRGQLASGPLTRTPYFTVDQINLPAGWNFQLQDPNCHVLIVVAGAARLEPQGPSTWTFAPGDITLGDTVIIPAAISHTLNIHATQDLSILLVGLLAGLARGPGAGSPRGPISRKQQ